MGTSWISRKEEILAKGGLTKKRGGMTTFTNYGLLMIIIIVKISNSEFFLEKIEEEGGLCDNVLFQINEVKH